MLSIQNISKTFGSQVLFKDISMQVNRGERVGLVGRNGHGKTTLFKMILKNEDWDTGDITFGKNYTVGHLAQHLVFTKPSVLEETCLGLRPEEADDHYKAETILFGLGFEKKDMDRAPAEFSGGFQIRLNLAKVLLSKPSLLLLDEPTNYLDIVSIRWLAKYLRSWPNELMIITHDRDFMDQVTTHTACIHRQKLKKVPGPTVKLYEQILLEEEVHEKTRINDIKKREKMDVFINRFRAKASKATVVQSRIKMRDKLPNLEELSSIESLDFDFRYEPFAAKVMMEVENLKFGFDPGKPLIEDLSFTIGKNDRIAIIGKNGKGKSTLLNLMAGELKPDTRTIKNHTKMALGYFGQTNIARLDDKNTVEEEIFNANPKLERTAVRNICGTMMFSGDLAVKKVSVLSGGEKSRVLLGKILAHPSNMLFLDEPTNHLDMESIQTITESIYNYEGAVVLVTHTEVLLRELVNKLIIFHRGGVEVFNGGYDEFLEKIGWEEEEKKKKSKKTQTSTKNEYKLTKEQAKEERKRKKEMENLEKQIMKLESQIESEQDALQIASEKQNMEKIRSLSESISKAQRQVDENFELLSSLEEDLNK